MSYKYIDENEAYQRYNNMLDECYPEFFGWAPSIALQRVDPIMYNCGFSDWLDAEGLTIDAPDEDDADE